MITEMVEADKVLIFLCASATKALHKKLSGKVAARVEEMKIGKIGNLEMLSHQHSSPADTRKEMIFINDCRSGCVSVLMHGFQPGQYLYLDVSAHSQSATFDLDSYINSEVLPKMNEQWNLGSQTKHLNAKNLILCPSSKSLPFFSIFFTVRMTVSTLKPLISANCCLV